MAIEVGGSTASHVGDMPLATCVVCKGGGKAMVASNTEVLLDTQQEGAHTDMPISAAMDIERGLVGEYNLAYFTATIHSWTIYHLLVVAAAIDVGQERCITGAGLDWVAKGASVHGSGGSLHHRHG
jgi:hypothetical protein